MTRIVKATSKGQVTLPAKWRKLFPTNQYLIKEEARSLIITPIQTEDLDEGNWEVLFDATRDNGGKGIPAEEMIRLLKKTL